MTDALLGCTEGSGVAATEPEVLRGSFVLISTFSDGAMLLLDLFVNLDTCGVLFFDLLSASLLLDFVGNLDVDFFLA